MSMFSNLWRGFPWHEGYQLNLDWILQKVKYCGDQLEIFSRELAKIVEDNHLIKAKGQMAIEGIREGSRIVYPDSLTRQMFFQAYPNKDGTGDNPHGIIVGCDGPFQMGQSPFKLEISTAVQGLDIDFTKIPEATIMVGLVNDPKDPTNTSMIEGAIVGKYLPGLSVGGVEGKAVFEINYEDYNMDGPETHYIQYMIAF